ncbi:hypothetical protein NUACC21_10430 [Scytonema sp. NUACC21]
MDTDFYWWLKVAELLSDNTVRSLIFEGREELIPDWVREKSNSDLIVGVPCNTWGKRWEINDVLHGKTYLPFSMYYMEKGSSRKRVLYEHGLIRVIHGEKCFQSVLKV